jgi:hypothetical protein
MVLASLAQSDRVCRDWTKLLAMDWSEPSSGISSQQAR